jgi:hypothetical protein
MSGRWVDLKEAAGLLDTSTEAVRKRATRGSLRSNRHDGKVVVWVDDGGTEGGREAQVNGGPLVEMLVDQVAYLRSQLDQEREANRENRRIIAGLTQRIPEIEAPTAPAQSPPPQGSHEGAAEEPAERAVRVGYTPVGTEDSQGSERDPWWRWLR